MPKIRFRRSILTLIAAGTMAGLVGTCTRTVALQRDYQGPLPEAGADGQKIALTIEAFDQTAARIEPNIPVRTQYLQLAESAFRQAGWTLAPEAPLQVTITLQGRTPTGLFHSEASFGCNLATGLLTAGIACKEWVHQADAAGRVAVARDGRTIGQTDIDLKGDSTSCYTMLNPNWLANHQEVALRNYEAAVQRHLTAVLLFVEQTNQAIRTTT